MPIKFIKIVASNLLNTFTDERFCTPKSPNPKGRTEYYIAFLCLCYRLFRSN